MFANREVDCLLGVPRGADELEALFVFDELREGGEYDRLVVGDKDPESTRTLLSALLIWGASEDPGES